MENEREGAIKKFGRAITKKTKIWDVLHVTIAVVERWPLREAEIK